MTKKTEWTNEQIEYLKERYLYDNYTEMVKKLGMSHSVIWRKMKELNLPPRSETTRIEKDFGMDVCKLLNMLHWEQGMSVNQMEKHLGVSRLWINNHMRKCGIEWRGQSEAQKKVWADREIDERKKQVAAAHDKARELAKEGNLGFHTWERENPELALKQRQEAGKRMSATREANGNNWMTGKVGPLCPSWKGGKDYYHYLRGTAEGNWRLNRKLALERDDYTCQRCRAKVESFLLHVHHKIPLKEGGTNLLDNLICYCNSCHKIVENDRW